MARQFRKAFGLFLTADFIGNENAGDAVPDQDLGFAQGRAGHADRPGANLFPGKQRRLMVLEMRTQLARAACKKIRHVAQVPLHGIEIHDQRRRLDVAQFHGYGRISSYSLTSNRSTNPGRTLSK